MISLSSLSKTVAPGIRLGWVEAGQVPELLAHVGDVHVDDVIAMAERITCQRNSSR